MEYPLYKYNRAYIFNSKDSKGPFRLGILRILRFHFPLLPFDGSEVRQTHQLRLVVLCPLFTSFHKCQVAGLGISEPSTAMWKSGHVAGATAVGAFAVFETLPAPLVEMASGHQPWPELQAESQGVAKQSICTYKNHCIKCLWCDLMFISNKLCDFLARPQIYIYIHKYNCKKISNYTIYLTKSFGGCSGPSLILPHEFQSWGPLGGGKRPRWPEPACWPKSIVPPHSRNLMCCEQESRMESMI